MSLTTPPSVQKLQTALHDKAKGSPSFRFYALYDKVEWAPILRQPVKTQFSLNGKGVYELISKAVHKRVQGSRREAAGTGASIADVTRACEVNPVLHR